MTPSKITKEQIEKYDKQGLTEKQIIMRTGLTRTGILMARRRYGLERK